MLLSQEDFAVLYWADVACDGLVGSSPDHDHFPVPWLHMQLNWDGCFWSGAPSSGNSPFKHYPVPPSRVVVD